MGSKFDKGGCMAKMIFLALLLVSFVYAQTVDDMFRAQNGNEWAVEVADWGYILSAAKPRPAENGTVIKEDEAVQVANNFLEINARYFGIESLNYTESAQIRDAEGKRSWVVVYEGQRFEGLPVMDTHTTVIMTLDGQVFAVGNLRYHFDVDVLEEVISQSTAEEKAGEVLGTEEKPIEIKKQIKPIIEENKTKPKVIWNITYGCPINKDVIVDNEGNIVEINNNGSICKEKTRYYWIVLVMFLLIILFLPKFFLSKKRRKSKGIAFGLLLVLVSLTLISLVLLQKEIYKKNIQKSYIENRIDDINNLFDSITLDFNKAIDITAKRAIAIADSKIITSGNPLTEADKTLKELILFGSIDGEEQVLMENATINNWLQKVNIVGKEKGYDINIKIESFSIKPYDSFNLIAEGTAWINISDQNGLAAINRKYNFSKKISVENFEDPLYPLNTNSKATKIIKKSKYENNFTQLVLSCQGFGQWKYGLSFVSNDINEINNAANKSQKILVTRNLSLISSDIANQYLAVIAENDESSVFVSKIVNCSSINSVPSNTSLLIDAENGKVWIIENLIDHYNKGYYSPSLNGPSFLDRLEGKLFSQEKYKSLSSNIIGMESFVNKDYFDSIEIPVMEDTNVDYLYFNQTYFSANKVKGMPNTFLIDEQPSINASHQNYYGVSQILRSS